MNTTNVPRGIGMKYTRYLLYGNYYKYNSLSTDSKLLKGIVAFFELIRIIYLLGFSFFLFPFALTLDTGRLFLYTQIRISRKLKQFSFAYNLRKNTINLVNRGSRMAYMIIQKTDFFIHLKH